ncbi:MAG: amidohydrolase family protein [Deltaproteobacteria bacterium]
MDKLILSARTVLPVSSKPLKNVSLLVAGGKIREIGKTDIIRRRNKSVKELDLGEGILLPGFVNAHTHLELGWIKERLGNFDGFTGWLEQIVKTKRDGVSENSLTKSVREGIDALIGTGVTTVGEISSYGGVDKPILKNSGLRTVLYREIMDSNENEVDFYTLESGGLFQERLFPHAPYSCGPRLIKKALDSHDRNGVPLGIHLAESTDEVRFVRGEENGIEKKVFPLINKTPFERPVAETPYAYLKKSGLAPGAKITLVHMVHVGEEETGELRDRDIGIVLCPRSNFLLQVGEPPLKQYAGLERVGLGTDGLSSNYNLDFFEEIRFLHLLMSRSLTEEAARRAVHCATLGGAGALYMEEETGSIEAGKEADLIFLKPKNKSKDPYLSVISSTSQDLRFLMVRGNILFSDYM